MSLKDEECLCYFKVEQCRLNLVTRLKIREMEIEIAQIERRSQHKQLIAKIRQEDRDLIDTSRLRKNLERMSKQRKNAIIKSFRNQKSYGYGQHCQRGGP